MLQQADYSDLSLLRSYDIGVFATHKSVGACSDFPPFLKVIYLCRPPRLRERLSCPSSNWSYGRCSSEDPGKSGSESFRISSVGVRSQCSVQFLSAAFSELRLEGSWFVASWYNKWPYAVSGRCRRPLNIIK